MIYCNSLNRSFDTKKEMFKALIDNKQSIIKAKKTNKIKSVPVNFHMRNETNVKKEDDAILKYGDTIYPVINTTDYMDMHDDVHVKGLWNNIDKANGTTKLVVDHQLSIDMIIAWEENVKVYTKIIDWTKLGKPFAGKTEALIFETVLTEEAHEKSFLAYKNKRNVQHSVRMKYIDIELAINDDELKNEHKTWLTYIDDIANKEYCIEMGYFWAIKSAEIVDEGSMVLRGSNDQTPVMYSIDQKNSSTPNGNVENEKDNGLEDVINNFRNIFK